MNEQFEQKLDKYAEIVVKIGLNIQEGQILHINSPIEVADFTRKVMKQAYRNGAKNVIVNWADSSSARIKYEEAPEDALKDVSGWEVDKIKELVDNRGALLQITGDDPKAFEGVDPKLIAEVSKAKQKHFEFFQAAQLGGDMHWAIVGAPTKAWAKMVFPDKSEDAALDALWEAVFKTVRLDQNDPVAAWEAHGAALKSKEDYMNEKHFKTLHYKSAVTDISIDLHPDHLWVGGAQKSTFDTNYTPNLPTEEIFTTPLKEGVNGTVTSTKPLLAMGYAIENFKLTFEKGKVVDFSAEKGYEVLEQLVNFDEGMHFLGEVALVPHDSPISNSGIVFNNTLYDENASCHVALGRAISFTVKGANETPPQELDEKGVNFSMNHVDFMIGSADLDIDGETEDGKRIPLFRKGNWVI